MRFPGKLYSFNESIFSKFVPALSLLQEKPYPVLSLFVELKKRGHVSEINEYILMLDYLYALKKITYEEEEGYLIYVA